MSHTTRYMQKCPEYNYTTVESSCTFTFGGEIAVDLVDRQAWAMAIITNEIIYWGKMLTIISHYRYTSKSCSKEGRSEEGERV